MSNLKPYPLYKDTGVSWLGEIPKHWQILPGKGCFSETKELNTGLKENTVLSLSYGKIIVKPKEKLHGLVPESFETYQVVNPGDIIIRSTDLQNDRTSLRFGLSNNHGIITSAYMRLVPKPAMTNDYSYSLLHSYDLKKIFYGLGSGLRQNLDWEDFKYLLCCVPPLPEQEAIVRYLNYMDRRIQRYINAKRQLIKLLNEQKQAIIHQAVIRGLNPNVRLKSSGLDWLGDIPEHWDVRPIKHLLSHMDYGTSASLNTEGDIKVVTMRHVKDGEVSLPESGSLNKISSKLLLKKNDLLFNRTNSPELVGKVGIFRKNDGLSVTFASYLVRLRTKKQINPQWLSYLLNDTQFLVYARSQALVSLHQANISSTRYGRMVLPVPSENERNSIAEYIEKQISKINLAISNLHTEIKSLQEYHNSIRSKIVTGKLDVRETATNLPEPENEPAFINVPDLDEEIDEDDIELEEEL